MSTLLDELSAHEDLPEIPGVLPVVPLRDVVVFPTIVQPLSVSRVRSQKAVEDALGGSGVVLLLSQKDPDEDEPGWSDLYRVGTTASVMRMLKLPDGRMRVLVRGLGRARMDYPTEEQAFLQARISVLDDRDEPARSLDAEALLRSVKSSLERSVSLGKNVSSEILLIASNLEVPGRLADLVASNLDLKVDAAQEVLETVSSLERLALVNRLLTHEIELLSIQDRIHSQARSEMDRSHREYFLRQQLKAIQTELGESGELSAELAMYRERLAGLTLDEEVQGEIERQLSRLERMAVDSAETSMLRSYLDWMTTLPWGHRTQDSHDLERARLTLDEAHHGLEDVKQRVLDELAVHKLSQRPRGSILCFVGPPGVGKTSLGRAIAKALGRRFARVSLGGVRDEAEIRGHRRTYVGALPGRIIQGIHQAGSANPVFMIDELDKIGADFRGDPAAALLEVLDPELNASFRDHYLGVPFDLSQVLFVATANLLDPIHPALRDRLEVIPIEGYSLEEKLVIARQHLLPRQLEAHGLEPGAVELSDRVLRDLVRGYTHEAGLRQLERCLATLCRKQARRVAEGRTPSRRLGGRQIAAFLGPARPGPAARLDDCQVGVATGLAWTATGGELLSVEASVMSGSGRLILTGQLGEVMQESARAALSHLRSLAASLEIDEQRVATLDVHVHVPEGAIPKDGPSAGITLAVALCSALTGRPVRQDLAMTGELTLRGSVLPVGGVRHKVLAARRAGLQQVVLPRLNRAEVEAIPARLLRGLEIHYVDRVTEVLDQALLKAGTGPTVARPGSGT